MRRTTAPALALLTVLASLAVAGWPTAAPAATFTVTSTADAVDSSPGDGVCDDGSGSCTLRAAIMEANALAGADTVVLPAGTYLLTIAGTGEDAAATGDLDVTQDLTITGAGRTTTVVDGGALDSVFHVDPAQAGVTVAVSDLTIRNGSGGLPYGGGGILNRGTLSLTRCRITENSATGGAGIYNAGPSLTVEECEISGNVATQGYGGGLANTDFRVDLENLLDNGHLDCDLGSWTVEETIPGAVSHSFEDSGGSTQSGSAEVYNPTTTGVPEAFALSQCVPLAAESGYFVGLRARVDAAPGVTLTLRTSCALFDQPGCLGATDSLLVSTAWLEETGGAWAPLHAPLSAPATSLSAWCSFALSTSGGSAFTGFLDRLELVPSDEVIFVDGFDTGHLAPWSSHEP